MKIWKEGEAVTLTCDGRTVEALVHLASPNGRSLAVTFDAIVAGNVGQMLLRWVVDENDGTFVDVLTGHPVTVGDAE